MRAGEIVVGGSVGVDGHHTASHESRDDQHGAAQTSMRGDKERFHTTTVSGSWGSDSIRAHLHIGGSGSDLHRNPSVLSSDIFGCIFQEWRAGKVTRPQIDVHRRHFFGLRQPEDDKAVTGLARPGESRGQMAFARRFLCIPMKRVLCTFSPGLCLAVIVGLWTVQPATLQAQSSSHHHKTTPAPDADDSTPTPSPSPSPTATPSGAKPSSADESAPSKADPAAKTGSPAKNAAGPAAVSTIEPTEIEGFDAQPEPIKKLLAASLDLTKKNLTYTYGSADPGAGGMDCSGTIYYLLKQAGFDDVPRDASQQYEWVRQKSHFYAVLSKKQDNVELREMRPGDLLFWTGTYRVDRDPPVTHVMVYLGKRKKDGARLMFGSSDGRPYDGQRRNGVSVFDFKMPAARSGDAADAVTTAAPDHAPDFSGYGPVPGMTDLSDIASRQTTAAKSSPFASESKANDADADADASPSPTPKKSRHHHTPES